MSGGSVRVAPYPGPTCPPNIRFVSNLTSVKPENRRYISHPPLEENGATEMDASSLEGASQANLHSAVSVKVARKTMDAVEQQGEAMVKLIQAAAELSPGVGPDGHIDIEA